MVENDEPNSESGSDSDGFKYDVSHGDSPASPVRPDLGGSVPVGPDPAVPSEAGVTSDPVGADLSAIFAAALEDEPPSTVTAESVLREVHGGSQARGIRRTFGEWLASGPASLKWGGGLIAAAALVAAVVVIGPSIVGSSSDSASSAGAMSPEMASRAAAEVSGGGSESSSAESAAAGSSESSQAGSSESSEERHSNGAVDGGSAYDKGPDSGPTDSAEAGAAESIPSVASADSPAAGSAADSSAADNGEMQIQANDTTGDTTEPAAPYAAGAGESSESAQAPQTSTGAYCPLAPLRPSEWSAAVAAVPAEFAVKQSATALCNSSALRGSAITVSGRDGQPDDYVRIIISQSPIGRDGAGSDSLVVSAEHGASTVTVVANDLPQLDEGALQRIARAVADAIV